jgi:hypothetical protein
MATLNLLVQEEFVNNFRVMLLNNNEGSQLLSVKASETGSLLYDINVNVTFLSVSGLQGLNRVVVAARVDRQFINLTKGIVAQFSPLNLASGDKDLSLLASDPLLHVRVLADTSVLVSVVSNDSE